MIGIVVATHGEFGNILLGTLKTLLGEAPGMLSIALLPQDSLETFKARLEKAVGEADPQGAGALVLVDMLGGTPFNVSVQLAQTRKLQVVTGVNLPMLIKVSSLRDETDLARLTEEVQKGSRESIVTTLELFKKKA
jgi:mannose PTS system EIIA component